jgi:hypothetical protein
VWNVSDEGGERMRMMVYAQVSVDTNESECLSTQMFRSQRFTGQVLLSFASS